jgi:DNA-directed RNA polymerase alpha subunit
VKTLDKSRPHSTVYGQADHAFEQDGLRFDREGNCLDKAPGDTKAPPSTAAAPAATTAPEGGQAPTGDNAGDTQNIQSLQLTHKVENALTGAGITTVQALCLATEAELKALPNIGEVAVKEIKKQLKAAGHKLAKA